MDFLNKIKSYISKWWTEQWKKEVKNEKKSKYLFRINEKETVFNRSRNNIIFHSKNPKAKVFSRFLQEKIISWDLLKTYGYLMSVIGSILIFLTIYIVVFSPYFRISQNQVIVSEMTPWWVDLSIAYRALEWVYGDSIFLIDEASIAKKLKLHLKNIASISIDRVYPNGIKVLITGAPILFDTTITGIPEKKWWLSNNWIFIPEDRLGEIKTEYHLNITSQNLVNDLFLNYKQWIEEYNMEIISKIFEVFTTEWADIKISRSGYFAWENELHMNLESGTKIIFSLQDDSNKQTGTIPKNIFDQLITLKTYILKNQVKLTNGSIEYIDARIPGKLFICSEKEQCKKNLILIYGDAYR